MARQWPGSDCASIAPSFVGNHHRKHWESRCSWFVDSLKSHLNMECDQNGHWRRHLPPKWSSMVHGRPQNKMKQYTRKRPITNLRTSKFAKTCTNKSSMLILLKSSQLKRRAIWCRKGFLISMDIHGHPLLVNCPIFNYSNGCRNKKIPVTAPAR